MHRFRVWAPKAERVRVEVDGQLYGMAREDGGWWEAEVSAAGAGSEYAYFLDKEDLALPDPRSPRQPHGVHGTSQVVDLAAFAWNDAGWQAPPLKSGVVYELHVGTFTPEGTLDAARGKLDWLRGLGVTHVQLMPVAAFPGKQGWGYDGVDLFAVHEPYGGPEALQRFVDACHGRGMAVLMDVVYNHLGPSGNYLEKFGPYFTGAHHTPWGDAVNLEGAGSHEVRRFFCDNARMWLRDYHCDGLRLDAVHAYTDRSAIHFMEQIGAEVCALEAETGRHYVVIAESDLNDPRVVTPAEAGGHGLDAQWSDDFHHALFAALTGDRGGYYADFGSLADLGKALREAFVYDGRYSGYRDRVHGRPVRGLEGWRFLGYAQTHDQVGNRAKGERLAHLVSAERAKIAVAMVMTAPFLPMIFQGEEWAASTPFQYFTDHEAELGKLVSEGRRKEFSAFGWNPAEVPDPQAAETYERSKLRWEERSEDAHAGMAAWYRTLIGLRKEMPELTDGNLNAVRVRWSEREQWFAMQRGRVTVAFSLAERPVVVGVPAGAQVRVGSGYSLASAGMLTLEPDGVTILVSDGERTVQ
ncbi:MAG TPA: malto-oligosyltrehalose trehalohydrolase [Acidobacteriaceae bacterium]|nr:malto-oligosyltrehalose trehalohydrolase [Acidobacteriaceae bacterium]